MLYEFVLLEIDGVNYREDEHGLGWLCLYQADSVARETGW